MSVGSSTSPRKASRRQPSANQPAPLRSLRRQWLLAAFVAFAALLAGRSWLLRTSFAPYADRWLGMAAIVCVVVLALLWYVLPRNHRPHEDRLFTTLGFPTWLTLLSGLLIAYLAGFLFSPWPAGWLAWVPAALYLASRIVDLFDGYIARTTDRVTAAGAALDIELDGLGLLIAVLLGVQYGKLPVWYVLLAVSRQLFVAGIWWRRRRHLPVYDLPPSDNRRITAGCQTGFISVALWPVIGPAATTLAAVVFAIPLVASFGRDWLVVSGAVDPGSARYVRFRKASKQLLEQWLPLLSRIAGTVIAAAILMRGAPNFTAWEVYFDALGLRDLRILVLLLAAIFGLALLCYALGIVGRLAALFVIALAILDMQATGLEWQTNALLLVCAIVVFHFGSGRYSLWQPEEPFLHRHLGGAKPASS